MKRMKKGASMKKLSLSGVKPETVIRTAVLAVTILNQILTAAGKNPLPFSDTELYEHFSLAASALSSLWAWWKNNSFTSEAQAADDYLESIRQQK
jgi:SPP1 family holin